VRVQLPRLRVIRRRHTIGNASGRGRARLFERGNVRLCTSTKSTTKLKMKIPKIRLMFEPVSKHVWDLQ
jgi:hypothetical protein